MAVWFGSAVLFSTERNAPPRWIGRTDTSDGMSFVPMRYGSRMIHDSDQRTGEPIALVPMVFIVTSNRTLRESLQSLVSGLRFAAKSFPDAESFLRQFRPRTQQLLLLDLGIPGMGGLALLEKLRDMSAELPVITIGDSYDVTSAVGAMQRGAIDYFEKPFVDNVLISRIEETIH